MRKGAIRENVEDVWYRLGFAASRHPIAAVVIGLFAFLFAVSIWTAITTPKIVPTPAQIAAEQESQKRQEEAEKNYAEQRTADTYLKKEMCRLRSACTKFATTRQDCATAGNYRICIAIKMGDDAELVGSCTNDGGIVGRQSTFDDAVTCFFVGLGID